MSGLLEGKELEQKIGDKGSMSLDVTDKGLVLLQLVYADGALKASSSVEIDLVDVLDILAKKTGNNIDDAMVASIKLALGR